MIAGVYEVDSVEEEALAVTYSGDWSGNPTNQLTPPTPTTNSHATLL